MLLLIGALPMLALIVGIGVSIWRNIDKMSPEEIERTYMRRLH